MLARVGSHGATLKVINERMVHAEDRHIDAVSSCMGRTVFLGVAVLLQNVHTVNIVTEWGPIKR